jgi:anti-anti-sigma factor
LAGELDLASAPHLVHAFETIRRSGAKHVTIDLRDLTFLDSTGVRAFLEADLASRNGRAGVSFIAGPSTVMKVLQLADVMDRLNWVEARAGVQPS